MKNLRIGILLVFFVWTGAWLSATENVVFENEQQEPTSKTAQADTVKMTWKVERNYSKSFSFYGEDRATYKVEWGDGQSETVKGEKYSTRCSHTYSDTGTYTVLLYGISK